MAIKIIIFCAIIATIVEDRVNAKSLFSPDQRKTISEDAFEVLEQVKFNLEDSVAQGQAKLDKLTENYKKLGDVIMKKTEEQRQDVHDTTLNYIHIAVEKADKLEVDITECNSDKSEEELKAIMESSSEAAKKFSEEYIRDSEMYVNTGKDEIIGMKSDVDELESILLQCATDDCFLKVSDKGRELITLIIIRTNNIIIKVTNSVFENYAHLLGQLNDMTSDITDEMIEIKAKLISCVDEKINNSV